MEQDEGKQLIFTIGRQDYSISVSEVESVLKVMRDDISPIPFDLEHRFIGIVNVKGNISGIIRDPKLTANSYTNGAYSMTALLLRKEKISFTLLVDAVKEITDGGQTDDILSLTVEMIDSGEIYD